MSIYNGQLLWTEVNCCSNTFIFRGKHIHSVCTCEQNNVHSPMLTVNHLSMNPLLPKKDDCVSIPCRHSSGCWTNRGEHGGGGRYTSNVQCERCEGEPQKGICFLAWHEPCL